MIELWIIVMYLLIIAQWIIIIHGVMSWLIAFNVINTHNDLVRGLWNGLDRITDPVYRHIRRFMPDFGALDLSPMVAILIVWLLMALVQVEVNRAYLPR